MNFRIISAQIFKQNNENIHIKTNILKAIEKKKHITGDNMAISSQHNIYTLFDTTTHASYTILAIRTTMNQKTNPIRASSNAWNAKH